MDTDVNCPFCLSNNLLKTGILYEDELWFFTAADSSSVQKSGLAVTRRHIRTPFEINEAEWVRLHAILPKLKNLIDTKDSPQGYNIGWNVHPTGGQTVSHAHMHLVARYDDEPLAGKGIRYMFKEESNRRQ